MFPSPSVAPMSSTIGSERWNKTTLLENEVRILGAPSYAGAFLGAPWESLKPCCRTRVFRIPEDGLLQARGSPSLVNGVGLRLPSLRGSRVRIPPPALNAPGDVLRISEN